VRYVSFDNRVGFATVTQIDEDQGQDYVSVGTEVEPKTVSYNGATE